MDNNFEATLQEYFSNTKNVPKHVLQAMKAMSEYQDKLETDIDRLRKTGIKVLADCETVGVEPFGARALREAIGNS